MCIVAVTVWLLWLVASEHVIFIALLVVQNFKQCLYFMEVFTCCMAESIMTYRLID